MSLIVARITSESEMQQARSIRRRVFVEEQGIDAEIEIDEHDADPATVNTAIHVLASADGEGVGTARVLLFDGPNGEAHIGRVAVLASHRGTGVGRRIMELLHDICGEMGYREAFLGAEADAVGFYERLGYECEGDPYVHVGGILHQDMRLRF